MGELKSPSRVGSFLWNPGPHALAGLQQSCRCAVEPPLQNREID